jgi:hypothetical protein
MNTLDREKLDSLLESVTLAKKLGFESLSSPVEPLLEAAIDVCLLLEKSFKEGKLSQKTNPSIKELDESDDLGNAKMIKLFKKRKIFFDPRVADIIKQFTAFFVLLKKSSEEAISFMETVFRTRFLPPRKTLETEQKSQKLQKSVNKIQKAAYYRRLRQRRSKNKTTI